MKNSPPFPLLLPTQRQSCSMTLFFADALCAQGKVSRRPFASGWPKAWRHLLSYSWPEALPHGLLGLEPSLSYPLAGEGGQGGFPPCRRISCL